MKYWMIVASLDHVMTGVAGEFCQANHGKRQPLARMRSGDWVIYYSPKLQYETSEPCRQCTAIGQVKDEPVYQVPITPNFSPYRLGVTYYPCQPLAIKPLVEQLAFMTNKQSWGYAFRFGFFEIPEADFFLLSQKMLENGK